MEILKNMVNELCSLNDKEAIVNKLQEIMKYFITNFDLKINNTIIEPIWIEAYYFNYFNENVNSAFFNEEREIVHCNTFQKNGFLKKLHFHRKKECQRNGVDICLSNGDYYLSLLIKNAKIDGVFYKQSRLANYIQDLNNDGGYESKQVMVKKRNKNIDTYFTARVGVDPTDDDNKLLACLIEIDNRDNKFTFQTGYGKKKTIELNPR